MNIDIAELGTRVALALDAENTGTLQQRIAAIASRAGTGQTGEGGAVAVVTAGTAKPDLRAFMTPMEFAALPSDVHHAVWAAYNAGFLITHPPKDVDSSRPHRYRRDQVRAIEQAITSPTPPQEAAQLTLATP